MAMQAGRSDCVAGKNAVEQRDLRRRPATASEFPRRVARSEQQIRAGAESFIIATSSAGACRAYSGTTMIPSAIIARSSATQRMLLAQAARSGRLFSGRDRTRKFRACCTSARNSPPVAEATLPSRISRSTGAPARFLEPLENVVRGMSSLVSSQAVTAPLCSSSSSAKSGTERRQIVFPAEHAACGSEIPG